jgi:hypothetical protein
LGVLIDDERMVRELQDWFARLWEETASPSVEEGDAYVGWLDQEATNEATRWPSLRLSSKATRIRATLIATASEEVREHRTDRLALDEVAVELVRHEHCHYSTVSRVVDELVERLTDDETLSLAQVVSAVRSADPTASVRDIYVSLLSHCANHVRSVFAEDTLNQLVIEDGRLTRSTAASVRAALCPFDQFLTWLVAFLSSRGPCALPNESEFAATTGVAERHVDILLHQLIEAGLVIIHDKAGATPMYSVDPGFAWRDRYSLFRQASALWSTRVPRTTSPEHMTNASSTQQGGSDEAVQDLQSGLEHWAVQGADNADRVFAWLLDQTSHGRQFAVNEADNVAAIAEGTGLSRSIVARVLRRCLRHPSVFEPHVSDDGTTRVWAIRSGLSEAALLRYPRTRAVYAVHRRRNVG